MSRFISLFRLGLGVVCFCMVCASGHPAPSEEVRAEPVTKEYLEDLFQKMLAHRERIQSGQMEIVNQTESYRDESLQGKVRREIKIVFDENRRRVDRKNTYLGNFVSEDVGCIGCYQKNNRLLLGYSNQFAYRKPDVDVADSTMCVIYDDKQLEENQLTKFWTEDYGFLPQFIACYSLARIPTKTSLEKAKRLFLANTVGMVDFANITIEDEEYKGVLCKKIMFESKWEDRGDTVLTTLWFSEKQGYSLLKHSHLSSINAQPSYEELFEVDVEQDKSSGIWFPSSWYYERKNDGKLHTRQNGTIKNVVLNQPIPEDVFDMKKIDILPKGVMVHWQATEVPPPHEGRLIWDGNDIVSGETRGEHLIVIPPRGSRLRKMLLINGAIFCFIAAAVSYRSYRRSALTKTSLAKDL